MKIINIFAILFLFIFGRPEARNFRNLRRAMPAKWSQKHTPFGSRIVGGSQSSPGMYPFFVEWEGCGASLIYEDIILSAAHCNVIDTDEVLIGAFQRDSETYGAELRTVVERREHPGYSTYTLANDFLVMKIDQASTKEPVPLNANPSLPQENDDLLVMGLGVTSVRVVASEFLREVVLKAVSHETCSEQYGGAIVEDVMLCAAVPEGGKDSCQG